MNHEQTASIPLFGNRIGPSFSQAGLGRFWARLNWITNYQKSLGARLLPVTEAQAIIRAWVSSQRISVARGCALLALPPSTYHYQRKVADPDWQKQQANRRNRMEAICLSI